MIQNGEPETISNPEGIVNWTDVPRAGLEEIIEIVRVACSPRAGGLSIERFTVIGDLGSETGFRGDSWDCDSPEVTLLERKCNISPTAQIITTRSGKIAKSNSVLNRLPRVDFGLIVYLVLVTFNSAQEFIQRFRATLNTSV